LRKIINHLSYAQVSGEASVGDPPINRLEEVFMSLLSTPIEFFTCARLAIVWMTVSLRQAVQALFRAPPGAPPR